MEAQPAPYFGAAYYPEGLSEERIDYDIRHMKETGINTVRLAEFAWSRMEPEEGRFDLQWLHTVIRKLGENNINAILCTPGATPPKWLTDRYPDSLSVRFTGAPASHGARTHFCPSSPTYRRLLSKINRRMAEEFSDYDTVIGWQIDNEVYIPFGEGCFCDHCVQGFRHFLQERFGTVENLNEAWQLTLWSQEYTSFDAVVAPKPDTSHHPSLKQAWLEYQAAQVRDYVREQVRELKAFTHKPIGTDMMPLPLVDHAALAADSDIAMFNHYCNEGSLPNAFFWMDFIKTLKDTPWWSTETDPNVNGGTFATPYRPAGMCRVNSWLPILFGGEANLYWHWRGHRSGHELMHGSVIDTYGRPTYTHAEICRIAQELNTARDFLANTKPVQAQVALHYATSAERLFACQSICPHPGYQPVLYEHFYRPLAERGIRVDVIAPRHDLANYNVIFSPLLPCLEEHGLAGRMEAWVRQGGTWIVGPLSDVRDIHGSRTEKPFAHLEDWADVYRQFAAVPNADYPFRYTLDGRTFEALYWADAFRAKTDGVVAAYTDAYELSSLPVITEHTLGKGKIVLLGTVPSREAMDLLLQRYVPAACAVSPTACDHVLAVPRKGNDLSGLVLVEYRNQPGWIDLPGPAVDVLTGTKMEGRIQVPPYGVMVLRYIQ